MMQYIADKKHFVSDGFKIFQANDLETGQLKAMKAYKYFIQVPYYNGNTLELIPLFVYGDTKYKDL